MARGAAGSGGRERKAKPSRFIFGTRLGLCPYIGPFGVAVLRNMAIIVLAGLVVSGTALGSFACGSALRLSDL
jgi:hypothetical protein